MMAGNYPNSGWAECNACGCANNADQKSKATAMAATAYVAANIPASVKVLYLGYDVGDRVHSGAILETCATKDNPCRHAVLNFKHTAGWGWARGGRASYDPLTTLLAVREASRIGLSECVGCDGVNRFDSATGKNHWVKGPRSNQSYVVLKDAAAAESALDELLCQPRLAGRVPKPPPPPRPPPAPPVIPNMGACTVIDVTSDSYGHLQFSPGVYFVIRTQGSNLRAGAI